MSFDFSKIPSQAPPEGVTSNFENPYSLAVLPRGFIYATLPPMVVFLGLRFYTRIKITRNVGIDDYLCALAAAVMIAYSGVMLTFLDKPAGRHMWDIPLSQLTEAYISRSIILTAVYMIAAMLIKASILCLYRRLFQISMTASVLIWIGLFVTAVFYLATFVSFLVGCIPRPGDDQGLGGWLSLTFAARCNEISTPTAAATGIVGSVLDIYILIIPLVMVSGLRASWRKKAGIFAIFIAGSSACVFSIVGTAYRMMIYTNPGNDITYTGMPIYAMNIGEINLGIISATMPVIFVLLKNVTNSSLTWISKLRYLTLGSGPKSDDAQLHSGDSLAAEKQRKQGLSVVAVPKGTLTGLRSWMRNKNRTVPIPEEDETYITGKDSGGTMLTFVSAEYDYHRQLKREVAEGGQGEGASGRGTPPSSRW